MKIKEAIADLKRTMAQDYVESNESIQHAIYGKGYTKNLLNSKKQF